MKIEIVPRREGGTKEGGDRGERGHASHPVFYLKKSKHACIKVENRNSSLRAFRNNDVSAAG